MIVSRYKTSGSWVVLRPYRTTDTLIPKMLYTIDTNKRETESHVERSWSDRAVASAETAESVKEYKKFVS